MTFKELKQKIKEEQKDLAQKISRGKYLRKPYRRVDVTAKDKKLYYYGEYYDDYQVYKLSYDYRHRHIAYCQFFNNTPYNLIESQTNNLPKNELIEEYKSKWLGELDETLHNCA